MAITIYSTQNTKLYLAGVEIEGVEGITGPDGQTNTRDVTTLVSTGVEIKPLLPDYGQLTFTIFYDPGNAQHVALRTAWVDRTLSSFHKDLPDGTVETFSGYVTSFSENTPKNEVMTVDVTVKITGSIVYT